MRPSDLSESEVRVSRERSGMSSRGTSGGPARGEEGGMRCEFDFVEARLAEVDAG